MAFTSTAAENWHPLTWLSHALDYQLFALNPAGHHFDNVLIHAFNAALLFLLFAWVTKRVGPSLLVAALFAVHPLNVESVAWVAERKNVLSTLFFILAIGAYVRYTQKPDWQRYVLVAVLFAAGLMSKPMVITLPFVLLLLDYWPLDRVRPHGTPPEPVGSGGVPQLAFSKLLLEKVPLLFFSAASACITLYAQRAAEHTFQEFPLAIRIENALVSCGLYLWKMFWPARLALFYPHPEIALPAWQWICSALVLLTVTALVVIFRRKRYLAVGWFWFLGTLVPVLGLVQVGKAGMADRYAYIPLIGIFIMFAWSLADWAGAKQIAAVWQVVVPLCALLALAFATSRQISYWDSDYDLWSHTLAVTEANPFAHYALASALSDPNAPLTTKNRQFLDTDQKRMDESRRHYEEALQLYRQLPDQNQYAPLPNVASILSNLGRIDQLENRMDDARQHYEGALKIYSQLAQQSPNSYLPGMVESLMNLGFLERSQHQPDQAGLYFEEALKIDRRLAKQDPVKYQPDLASRLLNLGNFDTERNRMNEARPAYEEAVSIYRQLAQQAPDTYLPNVAGTLNNLAILDQSQNRIEESRTHYNEALTMYRMLDQRNSGRFATDISRVEAGLAGLGKAPRPH
ncbi:MAG: tetratricopeptide repeat protein [Terriglobales bacterium]